MSDTSIQVFENSEFGAIRVIKDESGEPWFVAKDVCDALGIRTDTVRTILDDDEVREIPNPNSIGVTHGRAPLIVSEAGIYSLILKSRKHEAHAFKRWVTHEVLPAIRRDGGYMAAKPDETPEQLMARALKVADEALRRRDAKIAELEPKAMFADAVSSSSTSILIGDLAKILKQNGYDTGQKRLFTWMRENGYLIKQRGFSWNMPTQRSAEMGLFEVKERSRLHPDGHVSIEKTTVVTGKGQVYFVNKLCRGRA